MCHKDILSVVPSPGKHWFVGPNTRSAFVCFALHTPPRINSCLRQIQSGWNNHHIRTEYNRSPYQLMVEGSLSLQRTALIALDFFERVDEDYNGVEEEGLRVVSRNCV